jgi:hypothetical protein
VIEVLIDHDIVTVPQPPIAIRIVPRRNTEIKSAEPETRRTSSLQSPDVIPAKSSGEVSVLPRMVEMIVRIIPPCIVPDSLAVGMNVRSIRMSPAGTGRRAAAPSLSDAPDVEEPVVATAAPEQAPAGDNSDELLHAHLRPVKLKYLGPECAVLTGKHE